MAPIWHRLFSLFNFAVTIRCLKGLEWLRTRPTWRNHAIKINVGMLHRYDCVLYLLKLDDAIKCVIYCSGFHPSQNCRADSFLWPGAHYGQRGPSILDMDGIDASRRKTCTTLGHRFDCRGYFHSQSIYFVRKFFSL